MKKHIETDFNNIYILDDHTVLVEIKPGMEVNEERSRYANELIANEMPADYAMILDRKNNYSIVPIPVYKIFNSMPRLKAIAIVLHDRKNFLPPSTEQRLYQGELQVFNSIDEAREWIDKLLLPA